MMSSLFPKNLIDFLSEIESLGFSLCLVGGAVRDYVKEGSLSHDLDFEVRSTIPIEDDEWEVFYKKLHTFFESKQIEFTTLPYLITRINFEVWSLEFSSPRIEIFKDNETHTHHNFEAKLSSLLNFRESFKRRDFTINAIGLELDLQKIEMNLIDPFEGEKDIKKEILNLIDSNFFNDSVRFLRLIRFATKYNFKISQYILNNLNQFNLSKLSEYHFKSELIKSHSGEFLKLFKKFNLEKEMSLSSQFDCWLKLDDTYAQYEFESSDELLVIIAFHQPELLNDISTFFKYAKDVPSNIQNYLAAKSEISQFSIEEIRHVIDSGNLEFSKTNFYRNLKIIEKNQKWRELFNKTYPDFENDINVLMAIKQKVNIDQDFLLKLPETERGSFKLFNQIKRWCENV